MKRVFLEAEAGITIYASTGYLGKGQKDRMSTLNFYKASKGDKICLLDENYYFNIATYSLKFNDKYIYTYCYEENESWTTYNKDLSGTTYIQSDYIFQEDVYFRICLKRLDGKDFTRAEGKNINNILKFYSEEQSYTEKPYFKKEIKNTVDTVLEKTKENSLVLGVLTDSHYTVNGTWEDTVDNIKKVCEKSRFNGIVHLGDLTDGMMPYKVTKQYAEKMIEDLKETKVPLYFVVGNHDSNYFYGNEEKLTEEQIYDIYEKHSDRYVNREDKKLYYYVDFERVKLRALFLSSFDYREEVRYGFSKEELIWTQETLNNVPEGYSVIVFSHEAPLAELDFWSDKIRNGEELMKILESYNEEPNTKVMAFIHGHTHADYIYTKSSFPIISIGCSKCEYFTDKKPKGSVTARRKLNSIVQDLWDVLIITPEENKIEFIRFGAGEDRIVKCR